MLTSVKQLNYAIVLCDDLETMKAFYRDLFPFPVDSESETSLTFRAGSVLLSLRKRTRYYDGNGVRLDLPGVQLAFLVSPPEVDLCHNQLVAKGVKILEPPTISRGGTERCTLPILKEICSKSMPRFDALTDVA